jgi:hypothetical protein
LIELGNNVSHVGLGSQKRSNCKHTNRLSPPPALEPKTATQHDPVLVQTVEIVETLSALVFVVSAVKDKEVDVLRTGICLHVDFGFLDRNRRAEKN